MGLWKAINKGLHNINEVGTKTVAPAVGKVINKGLKLYCDVTLRSEINNDELLLFKLSVLSLRHIGLMCSRGKGNVKCTLLKNNEDITEDILVELREKVN